MPFVRSNAINIFYEEQGRGAPLVLIMGLGASGSAWEKHVNEYQKHFRCILIDNCGAGKSDAPAGAYTTKMMAADIAYVIDRLKIKAAGVVGISMGSAIAQELALHFPHRLKCMVLVSSWSRCDSYTRNLFRHFKNMRALCSPKEFARLLQLWIYSPAYFNRHRKELIIAQQEALNNYMPLPSFQAQCDACATHDCYAHLQKIKMPVLLTVGDADIFIPLRLTDEIHGKIKQSKTVIFKGGGHCHHWEDPDRFNRLTTAFLRKHLIPDA